MRLLKVVGAIRNEINIFSDLVKDWLYSSAGDHVLYNTYLRSRYCVRGGLSLDVCVGKGCGYRYQIDEEHVNRN